MASKKIHSLWSVALGIQYNHYKSLYQFNQLSNYTTKDSDKVIEYYTEAEEQTWTPLSSSSNFEKVYVVEEKSMANTFQVDTVNLSVSADEYALRVDRQSKEKLVLMGAISIPLELHFSLGKTRITGGLITEFLIHNKIRYSEMEHINTYLSKSESIEKNNDFSSVNTTLINASIGLDYFISPHVSFGMKGVLGLSDFTNDTYFQNKQFDRNYALNLKLAYHWY